MENTNWVGMMISFIIFGFIFGFMALLLVKLLWVWTIPDIFPGAVEEGLVARTISWYTAFKIAIFMSVTGGLMGMKNVTPVQQE
ncbi:MAG: hypothetical protein C5S41_04060 [Candidatus Methanomarinus sp.]|nr:MAG: hypothetical protein C5S41_04060 [ANME-2 cluster archaeon]KAF5425730.1 hypothetical protein C5S42_09720 [ANME-2 cluster archaeon]